MEYFRENHKRNIRRKVAYPLISLGNGSPQADRRLAAWLATGIRTGAHADSVQSVQCDSACHLPPPSATSKASDGQLALNGTLNQTHTLKVQVKLPRVRVVVLGMYESRTSIELVDDAEHTL
jgi:hypothetical protein